MSHCSNSRVTALRNTRMMRNYVHGGVSSRSTVIYYVCVLPVQYSSCLIVP